MKYALKRKDRFEFICVSKTVHEFEHKIGLAYSNWKWKQIKTSNTSLKRFMERYNKVEVTIKPLAKF